MISALLFTLTLVLSQDPCILAMQKIKDAGHFKEASFELEYVSGELDQAEIDYLASYILVAKKFKPTDKEKLDFLNLWGRLR